jgi:vancomycin resistance protein YoaR
MAENLLLPAPKSPPETLSLRQRCLIGGFLFISLIGVIIPAWIMTEEYAAAKREAERMSTQRQEAENSLQSLIQVHESSLVRIMIDHQDTDLIQLRDLLSEVPVNNSQQILDEEKWKSLIQRLRSRVEQAPLRPGLIWSSSEGWHLQLSQQEIRIEPKSLEMAQANLLESILKWKDTIVLNITTRTLPIPSTYVEVEQLQQAKEVVDALVARPIILHVGDNTETLDLKSEKAFVIVEGSEVKPNPVRIKEWLQELAEKYYRPSPTLTITGKEEIRPGVSKAIVSGEFKEGQQIMVEEIYKQVINSLDQSERNIEVKLYEIPVKIFSEIEQQKYELLAVGYSEYSSGNDPNRVHNLTTGLKRINGIMIDPGQEVSFNRIIGGFDRGFSMGWGIFGSEALPVLGGGICQASTTFYRALLNAGIPITMRQNHSWDLSYYQKGGYGLDATVFPEKGVDVKAVNDLNSGLFLYAYTRPETEEAYVLIYGKSDGRKVRVEPQEEYLPHPGSKTLKWKRQIQYPNGEMIENEIVSRYRA